MALIKCSECGGEVSDRATSCPHCGNPNINRPTLNADVPVVSRPEINLLNDKKFSTGRVINALFWIITIPLTLIIISFTIFIVLNPDAMNAPNPDNALGIDFSTCGKIINGKINNNPICSEAPAPSGPPSLFEQLGYGARAYFDYILGQVTQFTSSVPAGKTNPLAITSNPDSTKIYPLEQINLWGYSFYASKIDGSGSIDIGSDAKQTIVKLFTNLGYPHSLTTNLVIVLADPTLMRANDHLQAPWGDISIAIANEPNGGLYQLTGGGAEIYLNSSGGWNLAVLTHELGHQISFHMTDAEWAQYYKLRGISASTPRNMSNWNLSPEEDFAEVYRVTYGQGGPIQTHYGTMLENKNSNYSVKNDLFSPCYTVENKFAPTSPEVQSCRRTNAGVAVDPLGKPYYVNEASGAATAQFIRAVVARLNG